jgi:3-phosphoshikimate 1-carboxyvinyltransferase
VSVTVYPSSINGIVNAPASKSSMQRACALALLHKGGTVIKNPGKSRDDLAALEIIQKLGAVVDSGDHELKIKSSYPGHENKNTEINCGESGLSIRMFAPVAALSSCEMIITGEGSLLKRPMHFFDEVFPKLGVFVESNNGFLPIKLKGPLQPVDITIDGSLSSQFLTGLLMAYAKSATKEVAISVTNLKSKPYIDLTLQMMSRFAYVVKNENYERFIVAPNRHVPATGSVINYTVEGDWSGASFLLVAGAVAGDVVVDGLDINSAQADKAIVKVLETTGANVSTGTNSVAVQSFLETGGRPFYFDATDCPDLFPPLVALAAYCRGVSVIEGVSRLQHKESNRAMTLQQEFGKMGVEIAIEDDKMVVKGTGVLKGTTVHSHHDHRIAMACAIAALKADGETVIEEAGAVNKSYPDFFEDLKLLGADVSLPSTDK